MSSNSGRYILTALLLLSVQSSVMLAQSVMYMVVHNSNSSCPIGSQCHTLAHYTANIVQYFAPNVTLIFEKGTHALDSTDYVLFQDMNKLALVGDIKSSSSSSNMETVITCEYRKGGFVFSNISLITIYRLAFSDCGFSSKPSLLIIDIDTVILSRMSIFNSNGRGVVIHNAHHVHIEQSTFVGNGRNYSNHNCLYNSENETGNMWIFNAVFINMKSVEFSSGCSSTAGGGLRVTFYNTKKFNHINLDSVKFQNNVAPFGGNMAIEISQEDSTGYQGNISIENSHFIEGGIQSDYIDSAEQHAYGATGLSIEIQANVYWAIVLNNNTWVGNKYGALTIDCWYCIHYLVYITGNDFFGNVGEFGAIMIIMNLIDEETLNHHLASIDFKSADLHKAIVYISNSTFQENSAKVFSSGITAMVGSGLMFEIINCSFHYNMVPTLHLSVKPVTQAKLLIKNTTVAYSQLPNEDKQDVITEAAIQLDSQRVSVTFENVIVIGNEASGMKVKSDGLLFMGQDNVIANNTSSGDGGGMILDGIGILTILGSLVLSNNKAARYGGAIYMQDDLVQFPHSPYRLLQTKQTCSVRIGLKLSVNNTPIFPNSSIVFVNNMADISGNSNFGGILYFCDDYNKYNESTYFKAYHHQMKYPLGFLNCTLNSHWSYDHTDNTSMSSLPGLVCLCSNSTMNCTTRSTRYQLYPAQTLALDIVTVGKCGGVSPGAVVTTMHGGNFTVVEGDISTQRCCKPFHYIVKSFANSSSATMSLKTAASPFPKGDLRVNITFLPCPAGFKLDTALQECVCDSVLTDSIGSAQCDINTLLITRSGNNWLSYLQNDKCVVAHRNCPYDYCRATLVSFDISAPEAQCTQSRTGILCGHCQPGLSLMLGSNRCTKCSNVYLGLIPIFMVAGVALVVILIALNLTVSVGSINGLLFYANIIKLNEAAFIGHNKTPVLNQFISWLNLDFGIESCFLNGLDGYTKTWLQFVFPLYLWLLVVLIIVACHYSSRWSRLCGRNAVPVLATLFLMSFTKLLRTVTNALSPTTLQCGATSTTLWYVDGNIQYFSTRHIILMSVSLCVLVIGLVYTVLVFSSQWLQRYSSKCFKQSTRDPVINLKPLIDAYCGPYRDKCRYWTGLLLVVRITVTAVFSYTSGTMLYLNSYIIMAIVFGLLGCMAIYSKVYRSCNNTILETISLLNLAALSVANCISTYSNSTVLQTTGTIISLTVSLAIFLAIVLMHIKMLLKTNKQTRALLCNRKQGQPPELGSLLQDVIGDDADLPNTRPAVKPIAREEMIFEIFIDGDNDNNMDDEVDDEHLLS